MPTATPNFAQTPVDLGGELNVQSGTATQDIQNGSAPAGGLRIDMIGVSNSDASPHDVMFITNDGTNDRLAWTVTIAASAGQAGGNPPVSALNRSVCPFLNADGAIWLQSGWKLRWASLSAVAAGKAVRMTGFGAAWL